MAEMNAKFPGRCRKCGGRIDVGDAIFWSKETGALHPGCKSDVATATTTTTATVSNGGSASTTSVSIPAAPATRAPTDADIQVVKDAWIKRVHVDEEGGFSECEDWCDDCFWYDHIDIHAIPPHALSRAKQLSTTFIVDGGYKSYTYYAPTEATLQFLASLPEVAVEREKLSRQRQEAADERQRRAREAEEKRQKAADEKAKVESWTAGKERLVIPERDIKFEKIDEVTFFSNTAGSRFTQRIKYTAPPEIAGLEGAWVADHNWDTHYDTYLVDADVAKKVNDDHNARAWIAREKQLRESPSSGDAATALNRLGSTEFYDHSKYDLPQASEFFAVDENCKAVIETFKASYPEQLRNEEIRPYGSDQYDKRIAEALGIVEQMESVVAERKERRAKLIEELNDARDAKARDLKEKRAEFIATIDSKTKEQLLAEYGSKYRLVKSWSKARILDIIASREFPGY